MFECQEITLSLFDNEYILTGTIDRSANYKFHYLSLHVIQSYHQTMKKDFDVILYSIAFGLVITRCIIIHLIINRNFLQFFHLSTRA